MTDAVHAYGQNSWSAAHLHELQHTIVPGLGTDGRVLPLSAVWVALVHHSNPVLDPEVALWAGQSITFQVDAKGVEGLIHPNAQLTGACLKEPAGMKHCSLMHCKPDA